MAAHPQRQPQADLEFWDGARLPAPLLDLCEHLFGPGRPSWLTLVAPHSHPGEWFAGDLKDKLSFRETIRRATLLDGRQLTVAYPREGVVAPKHEAWADN